MDDLRWYKIFVVKFQMSTRDAEDGSFKSYLTNIGIDLNTATRDLFHSMGWSLEWNLNNHKYNMISHGKSSCIVLNAWCMPKHLS